jgi:hypothetical protein
MITENCDRCGEEIDEHMYVHDEPCASELIHNGWEIA